MGNQMRWVALALLVLALFTCSALAGVAEVTAAPVEAEPMEEEVVLRQDAPEEGMAVSAAEARDALPKAGGVAINATNFPDAAFRAYVKESFDGNGDGFLSSAEIAEVEDLQCSDSGITSLKGIGFFTGLHHLYCANNRLTSLDISNNKDLYEIVVNDNQLTSLDISSCRNLYTLYCQNNRLKALDLRGHDVVYLDCSGNGIAKLDISQCSNLIRVYKCVKGGKGERHQTKDYIYYDANFELMMDMRFDVNTELVIDGKVVDGGKSIIPTGVSLDKTGTVKLKMTDTLKLKATMKPTTALSKLTWKSSDKKVATISSSGVVKPKKPGTTTITVKTANGKSANVKVKVEAVKPTKVKITKGSKASMYVGDKLTLKAKLSPTGATSKLTWKSSDKKVATVSSKGVVTAKKKGTATITVKTANGKKAKIAITVKKKPVELAGWLGKDVFKFAKQFGLTLKSEIWFEEGSKYGYEDYYGRNITGKNKQLSVYAVATGDTKAEVSKITNCGIEALEVLGTGYSLFGVSVGMKTDEAKKVAWAYAKKHVPEIEDLDEYEDYFELRTPGTMYAYFEVKNGKISSISYTYGTPLV